VEVSNESQHEQAAFLAAGKDARDPLTHGSGSNVDAVIAKLGERFFMESLELERLCQTDPSRLRRLDESQMVNKKTCLW
jgi:hypothetical protein